MDDARREEILAAYRLHASIFDEVARRCARASAVDGIADAEAVPAVFPHRYERSSDPFVQAGIPFEMIPRFRDVLALAAGGYTNEEIGARLCVSVETVKWYFKRIFVALAARNRAHAVAEGYRLGVLTDGQPLRSNGAISILA